MPDWAITRFIKSNISIANNNVVAITLGAGSTANSQKVFEKTIVNNLSELIDSKTFWLWRP